MPLAATVLLQRNRDCQERIASRIDELRRQLAHTSQLLYQVLQEDREQRTTDSSARFDPPPTGGKGSDHRKIMASRFGWRAQFQLPSSPSPGDLEPPAANLALFLEGLDVVRDDFVESSGQPGMKLSDARGRRYDPFAAAFVVATPTLSTKEQIAFGAAGRRRTEEEEEEDSLDVVASGESDTLLDVMGSTDVVLQSDNSRVGVRLSGDPSTIANREPLKYHLHVVASPFNADEEPLAKFAQLLPCRVTDAIRWSPNLYGFVSQPSSTQSVASQLPSSRTPKAAKRPRDEEDDDEAMFGMNDREAVPNGGEGMLKMDPTTLEVEDEKLLQFLSEPQLVVNRDKTPTNDKPTSTRTRSAAVSRFTHWTPSVDQRLLQLVTKLQNSQEGGSCLSPSQWMSVAESIRREFFSIRSPPARFGWNSVGSVSASCCEHRWLHVLTPALRCAMTTHQKKVGTLPSGASASSRSPLVKSECKISMAEEERISVSTATMADRPVSSAEILRNMWSITNTHWSPDADKALCSLVLESWMRLAPTSLHPTIGQQHWSDIVRQLNETVPNLSSYTVFSAAGRFQQKWNPLHVPTPFNVGACIVYLPEHLQRVTTALTRHLAVKKPRRHRKAETVPCSENQLDEELLAEVNSVFEKLLNDDDKKIPLLYQLLLRATLKKRNRATMSTRAEGELLWKSQATDDHHRPTTTNSEEALTLYHCALLRTTSNLQQQQQQWGTAGHMGKSFLLFPLPTTTSVLDVTNRRCRSPISSITRVELLQIFWCSLQAQKYFPKNHHQIAVEWLHRIAARGSWCASLTAAKLRFLRPLQWTVDKWVRLFEPPKRSSTSMWNATMDHELIQSLLESAATRLDLENCTVVERWNFLWKSVHDWDSVANEFRKQCGRVKRVSPKNCKRRWKVLRSIAKHGTN